METLIINQSEVRGLLPMDDCIVAVRDALITLADGGAIQPLRPVMWLPDRRGALGMMPGHLESIGMIGIKTISVFPGNAGTEYDSHQGTVALFDDQSGALVALIDATEITAIRTAAASAVATDALARPEASVMAILGSGVQAASHIESIPLVRPVREVRVWSRNPDNAQRLAVSAVAAGTALDVDAVVSVAEAVAGADIVCTTTASPDPVLFAHHLEPGMHINAVGSSVPSARELDGPAMARTSLFVDRRQSTLNEAGDFLLARDEGFVTDDHILGDIGDVLTGRVTGRQETDEITLFESLGLAVEDIAAGHLVYQNALDRGVGQWLALGGRRHA